MSRREVVEWGSRERMATVTKREDTIFVARHALDSKRSIGPKANLEPVVEETTGNTCLHVHKEVIDRCI